MKKPIESVKEHKGKYAIKALKKAINDNIAESGDATKALSKLENVK